MKRRYWLMSAAALGGALMVGWSVMPARSRKGAGALLNPKDGEVGLNGWIKIAPDGGVVLAMPRAEMGQGIHSALSVLVAEELDIELSRVRLQQAPMDAIYGNVAMWLGALPFHPHAKEDGKETMVVRSTEWIVGKLVRELGVSVTGGSSSIADAWVPLRLAAAAARGSLLGAASLKWKLPVAELSIQNGVISHASGNNAHFGELAEQAANTPSGDVRPKPADQYKIIGSHVPRTDLPPKVFGKAQFGIDVRQPGQLFAVVHLAPALGGGPGSAQVNAALAVPGVQRVVALPAYFGSTAGFAVVGVSTWHAQRGAQALDVQWQPRPAGPLNSSAIAADLQAKARAAGGFAFHDQGSPVSEAVFAKTEAGAEQLRASYRVPYLAHATLEPMNCTAQVTDAGVEIWVPTQAPHFVQEAAARVAGVAKDKVKVNVTLIGGGFGRRLEADFVGMAVRVAMDCGGKPVLVTWSREQDTTHDFYRPAQHAEMFAQRNAQGQLTHLQISSAGDAISPRWLQRVLPLLAGPVDTPDKTTAEGLFDLPYRVPNQRMSHVATRSGVPIGFWRSVGHSGNGFMSESFVDECAHWLKQDPLAFRLGLLKDAPRHDAVLRLVAAKAGWGSSLPIGRARGVALHESFNSIVAQVVELSLGADKTLRVHRVVCAIDCGQVVHPDTVAQQMEGSVVFALSAALYGQIDIKDSVVQQKNFNDYQLLRMAHSPVVETHIVRSARAPGGVGEPGVPPLAAAVANALFVLTGQRIRELPLRVAT